MTPIEKIILGAAAVLTAAEILHALRDYLIVGLVVGIIGFCAVRWYLR